MAWFLIGLCTGGLLTSYLFIGADRARRKMLHNASGPDDHAQRWKNQRPLPPI